MGDMLMSVGTNNPAKMLLGNDITVSKSCFIQTSMERGSKYDLPSFSTMLPLVLDNL